MAFLHYHSLLCSSFSTIHIAGEIEMNGTHQFVTYTDDVNLLGQKINNRKKSTDTLLVIDRKVGLQAG
jgi:hypothetical protein